jgi:hypothetical protein
MGTDIHPAIEYRVNESSPWHAHMIPNPNAGRWAGEEEFTASIDIDRCYDLFSILGNVRNGYAFAGIPTGSGYIPMSDCRGVPEDISPEAAKALSNGHSATWVTLQEILDYDWTQTTTHTGVISAAQYIEYQKYRKWKPTPRVYSGGISGGGTITVSEEVLIEKLKVKPVEDLKLYYVQLTWSDGTGSYAKDAIQLWTEILPIMLKYGKEYGYSNVRLVMDFDS